MKVSVYSREAIEEKIKNGFPENVAVISFYDPPGKYRIEKSAVDYQGKAKKLFQVAVHDIDLEVLEDFERKGITIFRDYRYYPNQLIFNKVYDALERMGK